MVGVPPSGGFHFPAGAGTPTDCRSHLETEEPQAVMVSPRNRVNKEGEAPRPRSPIAFGENATGQARAAAFKFYPVCAELSESAMGLQSVQAGLVAMAPPPANCIMRGYYLYPPVGLLLVGALGKFEIPLASLSRLCILGGSGRWTDGLGKGAGRLVIWRVDGNSATRQLTRHPLCVRLRIVSVAHFSGTKAAWS